MYKVDKLFLQRVTSHDNHWLDKDPTYWFLRLTQEIGELGGVLAGDHDDPIELELSQIAGICLNWLRRMERDGTINMDAVRMTKKK
jgi:hypothetical protein